ncbi:MAG: hypothetical protein GY811_29365 [Myxococcales bacterium]|nr:hypothetical protein [Myxococcales bacterium]
MGETTEWLTHSVLASVDRFNDDNPLDVPNNGGTCPTCNHNDCFGQLDDNEDRWSCFSSDHQYDSGGCGIQGDACWHGDALDLEAYERNLSRAKVLLTGGLRLASSHP